MMALTKERVIQRLPFASRRLEPALPVAFALITTILRATDTSQRLDDAYITWRYARNVALGLGFVFNLGEHVLGTTTPLWTLILAAFYAFGLQDLATVSRIIGSVADGALVLLVFALARRLDLGLAGASAAALLVTVDPGRAFTSAGMESPFFAFLVMSAVAADFYGHESTAASLAAMATLTRPEGGLVAALIIGRHLLQRRIPLRQALIFLGILAPWVIFATWYFGNPLPQSMLAKAQVYQAIVNPLSVLVIPIAFLPIVLLGPFCLGPFVRYLRANSRALPLALFGPIVSVLYVAAIVHGVPLFPWYLGPLVPFYAIGLFATLKALGRRYTQILPVALGLLLVALAIHSSLTPSLDSTVQADGYAQTGQLLAPEVTPQTTILATEVGALGYTTDATILDADGLVSPAAVRYYPLPFHPVYSTAIPPAMVQDLRPDYIVSADAFVPAQLTDAPWFQAAYRLKARVSFRYSLWNGLGRAVLIYERVVSR